MSEQYYPYKDKFDHPTSKVVSLVVTASHMEWDSGEIKRIAFDPENPRIAV